GSGGLLGFCSRDRVIPPYIQASGTQRSLQAERSTMHRSCISGRVMLVLLLLLAAPLDVSAQQPRRIFISVDMEGISGIGTSGLTSAAGKDYATGRRMMTDEVNAVVSAIFAPGPAEIVVNDSHGDMQNLLHTDL